MKHIAILLCFLGTATVAIGQKIPFQELDYIKGKYFQRNTVAPFSGKAIDKHYNGKKKLEINIKDGQLNGVSREWAFNGEKIFEANYEKNIPVGTEIRWYDNGNKKQEVRFVNGLVDGIATEWYANAQKMSEGKMVRGVEEGLFTWWYKDGQKEQEVNYKNGVPDGVVKKYHPQGQVQLESHFKNGKKNGMTKEWFMNGQLNSEVTYIDDNEDGKAYIYSKKGIVLEEKTYKNGELIDDKNFRSGNIRTANGYVQVFNHAKDYYAVTVKSNDVYFREDADITFAVEGKLLQMFDYTKSKYFSDGDATKSQKELLKEYVVKESKLIKDATQFDIDVKTKLGKNKNGLEFIEWHFISPSSKGEQKPRTVVEEHYYSFIIGERILNLYSVVTNSDNTNEITNLLKSVSDSVKAHDNRIDLNQLTKKASGR